MVVTFKDDLDLNKIAESGQCFRWQKTEENTWQIVTGKELLYAKKVESGQYDFDCTETAYKTVWKNYFDMQQNYSEIRSLISPKRDFFLYQAAEYGKGIRILRQDPWEMLISFIISQRKSIPAIRTAIDKLCEMAGDPITGKNGKMIYTFPNPKQMTALSKDQLAACGLGYRTAYIWEAARRVANEEIDLKEINRLDDKALLEKLSELYGVGIKVANCTMLFGFHRLNSFPKDVWINRVLEHEYAEGYPFEQYSPYNGVMQQYMFFYYRVNKEM